MPVRDWDAETGRGTIHALKRVEGAPLPILHAIRDEFGLIDAVAVPVIAEELNLTRAEVHGVISFYHDFRKTAPGHHIVKICRAEASPPPVAPTKDVFEIHPFDAENRGIRDGDVVSLASRVGETTLHAKISDRMQPGVVDTTFHHVDTGANVVTTEYSDWATSCPEKVTAVRVRLSNQKSEWQRSYEALREATRKVAVTAAE